MRILIVEDEKVITTFLSSILCQYGECIVEDDGKKALGTFVKSLHDGNPFDLITLDIMMPEVDGIQFLRTMREVENRWPLDADKKAKVVMLTSVDNPIIAGETLVLGEAHSPPNICLTPRSTYSFSLILIFTCGTISQFQGWLWCRRSARRTTTN